MPSDRPAVLTLAIHRLLIAVAEILSFFNFSFAEAREMLKHGFVIAAKKRIERSGETPTKSRVALLTGLSRPEVAKLWTEANVPNRPVATTQILVTWFSHPEWQDDNGNRLVLPFEGEKSFSSLCSSCSTNYTPRTILTEFEAQGNVKVLPDGTIQFIELGTVPLNITDIAASSLRNVRRLLETVLSNLLGLKPRKHERLCWSWQIPDHLMDHARHELAKIAKLGAKKVADTLAAIEVDGDLEHNCVGLGFYYFEEKAERFAQ